MSDNTVIAANTGGDTIRDLNRLSAGVKTQVFQLDLGGSASGSEILITAGHQTMAGSMPVVIASDQAPIPVTGTFFQSTQPVSIAGSVAVTGTFFQGTQPVSIASPILIGAGGNKAVGPASIAASQATIGASGASIVAARTGAVGTGRCSATLKNTGAATVFIGSSTSVTTSTGYPLFPGEIASFDTTAGLFGISTAAGNVIGVLETF